MNSQFRADYVFIRQFLLEDFEVVPFHLLSEIFT